MSASAASLVYNPFDLLRSCMLYPIGNDMPLLASLEKKPKSDRQEEEEDIPMEQAEYDRDSDSYEGSTSRGTAKAEGNAYAASGANTEAYTEDRGTAIHWTKKRNPTMSSIIVKIGHLYQDGQR